MSIDIHQGFQPFLIGFRCGLPSRRWENVFGFSCWSSFPLDWHLPWFLFSHFVPLSPQYGGIMIQSFQPSHFLNAVPLLTPTARWWCMTISRFWIEDWVYLQCVSTLYISLLHTEQCPQSLSSLHCLVVASSSAASSASVTIGFWPQ